MQIEEDLVLRAAGGDGNAYEELVLRHRSEMLGWAHTWARDWDLSEDLYQEAVLKGYIHIGKLKDSAKFKPWMRKIIRNEFLMYLRRTRRELTAYMTLADEETLAMNADPSEMIVESLLRERMRELLERLSKKERAVFEAHIIAGTSIEETASFLNLQKGAVYTYLSRARSKLTEALFRLEIRQYLDRRADSGSEKQLRSVHLHWFNRTYNSMVAMMVETLQSLGQFKFTLNDVMGLSGHAFRIHASPDLGPSSAYGYDWASVARTGWRNLGYSCQTAGRPGFGRQSPDEQVQAIEMVHNSIDKQIPAMGWNLSGIGFGLIYGYDDAAGEITIMDTSTMGKRIRYEKLGRHHPLSELFVASIAIDRKVPLIDSLIAVLETIVAHLSGKEVPVRGYSGGLCAYDAWIQALQQPVNTDLFYIAMNADVVVEARKHASIFIRRSLNLQEIDRIGSIEKAEIEALANLYREISESWRCLAKLLWRSREEKLPSEQWQPEAVGILTSAKQFEAEAAQRAASLLNKIRRKM